MVTKKHLLNRIETLEKQLLDMNEKILYLWKEDIYKEKESQQSLFDEWINGAKVGETDERGQEV